MLSSSGSETLMPNERTHDVNKLKIQLYQALVGSARADAREDVKKSVTAAVHSRFDGLEDRLNKQ